MRNRRSYTEALGPAVVSFAIPPRLQCWSIAGYQAPAHGDRCRRVFSDRVFQEANADAKLAGCAFRLIEIIAGVLLLPFNPPVC